MENTYIPPDNERFYFSNDGRLNHWEGSEGRSFDIKTVTDGIDTVNYFTDSLGHSMVYRSIFGLYPSSLTVGDLKISYILDSQYRLTGVKKERRGFASVRTYLYEDATHPKSLTGIIDERGVRISTWKYDAQGRATSVEAGDGKQKFEFVYNADGTTKVKNPLGHSTNYTFAVVQGAKRIVSVNGEPTVGCPMSNSSFTYTTDGRLKSQTNASGFTTIYDYDSRGREISRTEALGTSDARTITTTWDGINFRPKAITMPDRTTNYNYDSEGRLLSTTVRSTKD